MTCEDILQLFSHMISEKEEHDKCGSYNLEWHFSDMLGTVFKYFHICHVFLFLKSCD